jgi:branched-chain amino acid transport system ATP-binding protein|tara:strand:+ start:14023 stop:14772 length:750 start_codon:yes stop_codon:yes gene_type:complete
MTKPVLKVTDITVRFGGLVAVNKAKLSIEVGELIGFVGPNGAGKTTLMRVITGIITPNEGTVELLGKNLEGLAISKRIRAGMALAQQVVQPLREMTLLENVTFACGGAKTLNPITAMCSFNRDEEKDRAMKLLKRVGLQDSANREPSELPLGYLKRLEVARALALDPQLLLLDEPLAGLNQFEAGGLADLIVDLNRSGLSILLIEHNLREVMRICPKVYVQDQGKPLAFGQTDEVMKRPDVVKAYLGGV